MKLKAVKTELILLSVTAIFLCGLIGLAQRDRGAEIWTDTDLPPEEIELALVDLNTADAAALTALPGIGESLAQRIIDYRTDNGPFSSVEALTEVSGIGAKKLEELRDYVTVSHS